MLEGILWILASGAPWRDLPECFGPFQNVHRYFSKWRKDGVFATIIEALQIKLDARSLINWELWCVDGASVRATRAAAGAEKKASSDIPTNRRTTRWAAAEAGLDRSFTWLPTAKEPHLPSKSPPEKRTNRHAPSRSSGKRLPA
jgi:transposase